MIAGLRVCDSRKTLYSENMFSGRLAAEERAVDSIDASRAMHCGPCMAEVQLVGQSWDGREDGSASDRKRCFELGSGWKPEAVAPTVCARHGLDGRATVFGSRNRMATTVLTQ